MAKQKYNARLPALAEKYARAGMIDKQIAKKLGICLASFYKYQIKHIEFMEALKRGKAPVDAEVENSLLKRTLGFEYEETTVEYSPGPKGGKAKPNSIKKTTKMVIPDVTACIFWLKNRKPQRWRDRHDFNVTGDMNIKVVSAVPRPKKKGKKHGKQ